MTTVFAYLDVSHPAVAWAVYRGVLVSAYAETPPNSCAVSMMVAQMLLDRDVSRIHNELQIELVRQGICPHLPSRLSAMYFFEDEAQARRVPGAGWGGHYFEDEYLAELELLETAQVARLDSNWITYAPKDTNDQLVATEWITDYWSGKPYPDAEPLWEILAHGRAVVYGTAIRERAYKEVTRWRSKSVAILEVGRVAACLGSDLGQVRAFLVADQNELTLKFHLDMRDANNSAVMARIANYDGPCNHADVAVGGEYFYCPDFQSFGCLVASDHILSSMFVDLVTSAAISN
ncbi:hypothetical protein [Chitinolyticbacter albus]|uniref:hypothetical protein n=1 Tax=Chitinolyticbacter albus TaxID=2961951 RepID=UPI002109FD58|nr:hypothetical protein [Chitinolyticbacter albus]